LQTRVNQTLTQTFGVDNANRLTNATRSGTLTAAGQANSLVTSVTVNGVGADLYTDKTFATSSGLSLNNGANELRFNATDAASQSTTVTQIFNLPATVSYTHDLNGNLLSDGALGYEYDDFDQLIAITKTNEWKSEFVYDGLGRRITRKEFTFDTTANSYLTTSETRYVWLGMRVLQERDGNNTVRVTYTAGLAREDAALSSTNYYFTDGNRNVSALIDVSGHVSAQYRYDSFGNLLSKSGPMADVNLRRFSSEEFHARSGLYYYGFRYYQPNLQRWLNQDPIGIAGGLNLYGFVGNSPVGRVDIYGLWVPSDLGHSWGQSVAEGGEILSSDGTGAGAVAWNTVVYAVTGLGESIPDMLNFGDATGTVLGDPNSTWKDGVKAGFQDGCRGVGLAGALTGPLSRLAHTLNKALGGAAKAGAAEAGSGAGVKAGAGSDAAEANAKVKPAAVEPAKPECSEALEAALKARHQLTDELAEAEKRLADIASQLKNARAEAARKARQHGNEAESKSVNEAMDRVEALEEAFEDAYDYARAVNQNWKLANEAAKNAHLK